MVTPAAASLDSANLAPVVRRSEPPHKQSIFTRKTRSSLSRIGLCRGLQPAATLTGVVGWELWSPAAVGTLKPGTADTRPCC